MNEPNQEQNTQQQILDAIEGVTAIVSGLSGNVVVVGAAALAIKSLIVGMFGEGKDAPEYADAMQRGLARNRQKIGDRIGVLEGQPPVQP